MPLDPSKPTLVAGGGGFIGGHIVDRLLHDGFTSVRAVDWKPIEQWQQVHDSADNLVLDLSAPDNCTNAADGSAYVFNLAADMGGMGFIELNKAACMLSVLTSTHMIEAARLAEVERYFYSSSACVYATGLQSSPTVTALKESDAYPADPEDGYGWEKLFSERMCHHYFEDFGLETRVARYHNVYGPRGAFEGGREKAPAAICRKVARAKLNGDRTIEIWGDGEQTRSFMYIDDCIEGTLRLTASDVRDPLNVGSSELVTINELVDMAEEIAGVKLERRYKPDAPQGVRGRNSDNSLIQRRLHWEPSLSLFHGLKRTYEWIESQLRSRQLPAF